MLPIIDPPPALNQPEEMAHLLNEVAPFRFGSIRRLILPPQTPPGLMTPSQVCHFTTTMRRTDSPRLSQPAASTPETLSSVDRASRRRYAKIPLLIRHTSDQAETRTNLHNQIRLGGPL